MEKASDVKNVTLYTLVFGEVVRTHRKLRGRTQAELAAELGIDQGTYSRLENGQGVFNLLQIRRAALTLGLVPAALMETSDSAKEILEKSGLAVLEDAPSSYARASGRLSSPKDVRAAAAKAVAGVAYAKIRERSAKRRTATAVHAEVAVRRRS